jgi:hypothetical protein
VIEPLRRLARGKTTILISHDLSLAPLADHVLMLDDGRLVEQGRHEDLVRTGGPYARLYAQHRVELGSGHPVPQLPPRTPLMGLPVGVSAPTIVMPTLAGVNAPTIVTPTHMTKPTGTADARQPATPAARLVGTDSRPRRETVGNGRWRIHGNLVDPEPDLPV